MIKGRRTIQDLSNKEKDDLLDYIIHSCLVYADDTSLLGQETLDELVTFGLLEYGNDDRYNKAKEWLEND